MLTGNLYAKDSRKVLFKFKRAATRSGSNLSVLREYTYPDGKLAAREKVSVQGDDLITYALEELQIGAAGSATSGASRASRLKGTLRFDTPRMSRQAGKPKTSTEALRSEPLVADMVASFLVSRWAELSRGDKVKCRYVVVPRRETVGFTFVKDSETSYQGRAMVIYPNGGNQSHHCAAG